jgi:hypothetical protein
MSTILMACCDRPLPRPKQLESLCERFGLVEEDGLLIIEDGQVTDSQAWQTVSTFHLDDLTTGVCVSASALKATTTLRPADLTRELRRFGFLITDREDAPSRA